MAREVQDAPRRSIAAQLSLGRLLWAFAVLSLALLGTLAFVPLRASRPAWREVQQRYNDLARAQGLAAMPLGIKQIFKPVLGRVDRCTSCHVGMGAARPVGSKLFRAHPPTPHVPQFGCTVCHGGQGRALTEAAAHGRVPFWDEPMLERPHLQAGCGGCHSHLPVPATPGVDRGRAHYVRASCAECHRIDGRGGRFGVDLSAAGIKGYASNWHTRHVEQRALGKRVEWARSQFAPLADDELRDVEAYLKTLVVAPQLMAGKRLSLELGCRGCHRINGVGGDSGMSLSDVGRKVAADFDFTHVSKPHTVARWIAAHLVRPGHVVIKSQMPDLGISAVQAEALTTYLLSLRAQPLPESVSPKDRLRGNLGERDFATDGESLYAAFCVACHGKRGAGRTLTLGGEEIAFPALGNVEFLALADDPFVRRTIVHGRGSRKMGAFGSVLRAVEIDRLVAFLRALAPPAPSYEAVMAAPVKLPEGQQLFAAQCVQCHGDKGQGSAIAPPLAAADNPVTRTDNRIYGTLTVGVAGTAMGAFRRLDASQLRALIAVVRALTPIPGARRTGWVLQRKDPGRGKQLFQKHCEKCHGPGGQGKLGPAIGTKHFLSMASDGYLAGTIIRGRQGQKMPAFGQRGPENDKLGADDVAAIIGYLRTLQGGRR